MNSCNRKCPYCKYGQDKPFKHVVMSDDLFHKILYDLSDIDFEGIISPFNDNEPMLDNRIFKFIESIERILPRSKIFMFSNGDLLDENKIKHLFDSGLDRLHISLHDSRKLNDIESWLNDDNYEKIRICKMYECSKDGFHNFAGEIESDLVNQTLYLDYGCVLPFRHLVVNSDGTVDLCCVDIGNNARFGNAKDRSIVDIFYNDEDLNRIRKQLAMKDRRDIFPCNKCSFHGFSEKIII
jgi:radical SAM protein with 4Fe4S-binding SPASM domain